MSTAELKIYNTVFPPYNILEFICEQMAFEHIYDKY